MSDTAARLNVYQRLNKIREAHAYIQKDKEVDGKYKVVTHDAVIAAIRESFVKNGVLTFPEQVKGEMEPKGTMVARDGVTLIPEKMRLYSGDYKIHFVNIDEPQDRFTVPISAHAIDNGDKAPGKAVTYATKAALLKVLMLETGEDEEGRTAGLRTITSDQVAELEAMLVETKSKRDVFLAFFKIAALDELPAAMYQQAKGMLQAKRQVKKEKAQ